MILLVDDDPVNTRVWSHLLTRMRRPNLAVTTGHDGLEALTTQPVDLLVCAVVLPDVDGLALIERGRAYAHCADIPVIVCTGQADEATVRRALALGVADFVVKPIRADRLLIRLEAVLKALPQRWEPRREIMQRLRITPREVTDLTALAHAELRELLRMLRLALDGSARVLPDVRGGDIDDAESPGGVPDAIALGAAVRRVRDAALTVGALRCGRLVDRLWRPNMSVQGLRPLLDAMIVEEAAFASVLRTIPARYRPEPTAAAA